MRFATLGPAGSNHAFVLHAYLREHGLDEARVALMADFVGAFEALLAGETDYVLQCSAHPAHAECVGRTMHRAFPVDCFIAPSRPLALLARLDRPRPGSVGLQPATRHYVPLDGFEVVEEPTTVHVGEGLLAGRYDAGICALDLLDAHPDRLRLLAPIGAAIDVWVLYSRERRFSDPRSRR